MSFSVFTQIASGGKATRSERLFRAAIIAFCALSRPTRAEIAQIDDLLLSLLPHVSPSCRRFAAAALSDCAHAPAGLVNRLCDEDVGVAAPLLARSPVLDASALIGLLRRHGLPHARVIARRQDLNPVVADFIQALFRQENAGAEAQTAQSAENGAPSPAEAAENARRRLRGMMRDLPEPTLSVSAGTRPAFPHLRDTALLDHRPFFHTALADALGIDLREAAGMAADAAALLPALHALGLGSAEAFLIVAAALPEAAGDKAAIRSFLDAFAELDAQAAETAASSPKPSPAQDDDASSQVLRFRRA